MSADTKPMYWGRPARAAVWHIFRDSRSLCCSWAMFALDEAVAPADLTDPERRKGDCRRCVRAAKAMCAPPSIPLAPPETLPFAEGQ